MRTKIAGPVLVLIPKNTSRISKIANPVLVVILEMASLVHLKNHADTEDIFQTVFLKYVLSSVSFESDEHEKAWFIRVTINACKDLIKSFFRSRARNILVLVFNVSSACICLKISFSL